MSSATPMAWSVWDVLLYTSAPSTSREPTRPLASAPVAAMSDRMPLRSSAAAALAIRSSEASSVNSADTAASGCATTCWSVTAYLRQPAVDERHSHRSLADGRCAAFDRPQAHITRGQHTGQIGLQRQRLPGQRPVAAWLAGDITAGHHVPSRVGDQTNPRGAVGPGGATDTDEQGIRRQWHRFGTVTRAYDDRAEAVIGLHTYHVRVPAHINMRYRSDLIDEVLRHRRAEIMAAD